MRPSLLLLAELLLSEPVEVDRQTRVDTARRTRLNLAPETIPKPDAVAKAEPPQPPQPQNFMRTQSTSVSYGLGADGKYHTVTRETEAQRIGEEFTGRVKECKDGECQKEEAMDAEAVEKHLSGTWMPNLFGRRRFPTLFETPFLSDYAFDELAGIGSWGRSWLDGSPMLVSPFLHGHLGDTAAETKPALEEEVLKDDTEQAKALHDLKKREDSTLIDKDQPESQVVQEVKKDLAAKTEAKIEAKVAEEETKLKAMGEEPSMKTESVTRTVVIEEKDGKKFKTKMVERCDSDGKCTTVVHHPDGKVERSTSDRHHALADV